MQTVKSSLVASHELALPGENGLLSRSEKITWVCFAATSAQLVFMQPYFILAPGERTNLFSGLLCFLTLVVTIIFGRKEIIRLKSPEFLVSVALSGLAVLGAWLSSVPFSASCRVFVLLASGLGGFWCARLLLNNPANQRRFQWLGLVLLAGLIVASLAGYLVRGGIDAFIQAHNVSLSNTVMLLSFAPLALLAGQSRSLKLGAVILLCAGYAILCLSQKISAFSIPVAVGVAAVLFGTVRLKHLVLALIPVILIVGIFYHQIDRVVLRKVNTSYPFYRIENFPFSWHIARQHPWFGIGLRTPREDFLQDYQPKYPYTRPKQFAKEVGLYVTADNLYLTFLTDLGFPFLIIYGLAVVILVSRLIRLTFRPPPRLITPPLALLLPLAMTLAHFLFYDGLLYPQNSWFFHLLLGLIPGSAGWASGPAAETT